MAIKMAEEIQLRRSPEKAGVGNMNPYRPFFSIYQAKIIEEMKEKAFIKEKSQGTNQYIPVPNTV